MWGSHQDKSPVASLAEDLIDDRGLLERFWIGSDVPSPAHGEQQDVAPSHEAGIALVPLRREARREQKNSDHERKHCLHVLQTCWSVVAVGAQGRNEGPVLPHRSLKSDACPSKG